jgi:ribosome-binding factor A
MKIEFLQEELAQIINREALVPGALITLNNLASDDKAGQIKVWVSVLPERFSGSALRELRKKANIISNDLVKKAKLRRAPRLTFAIDGSLPEAIELVNTIDNLWKE